MHVELRHLRYFIAVAEELNFSRAAERLHIAQPALSAQIRSLESQLGTELLARTTRKVELTPNGQMLLADAREIVSRADRAVAKMQAAARGEHGLVRIGFVGHGAGEVGTEILRRFTDKAPSVDVELVSASTLEEVQRHVVERETDVAFIWLPLLFEELSVLPIASEHKLLVLSPEHPLAKRSSIRAADLVSEPIVAPWEHYPPDFIAEWLEAFRPTGRRPDDPSGTSVEDCLNFVARGVALWVVPESVSRFYARPEVVFRPIEDVPPARIALAWRKQGSNTAVPGFVETARSVLADSASPAIHSADR